MRESMEIYPRTAAERAMKLQEVLLRATAEHLQAAHQPAVVSVTRTPEPARPQKVGDSHSVVRTMDPAPDSPAPLSSSSLLRHPSFVRAVCVDTLARICAGGDQRWSSLLRPECPSLSSSATHCIGFNLPIPWRGGDCTMLVIGLSLEQGLTGRK
jgi:hypothetical protein